MTSSPFRFAISASFTAEPIQPVIEFWGRRLNSAFEVRFAPYNQPLQTLLDPYSVFADNQHGSNVLLLRLEDLGEAESLEAHTGELVQVIRDAAGRFSVPLVVCLCPSSPAYLADPGRARAGREVCSRMAGSLNDAPGIQFITAGQMDRQYPVAVKHDPEAERLGRIPYTEIAFCAIGTVLVRHAHALFATPHKVIALDCDNTLWQGICGEDGPSGISLDPPRRALQEFMLEQREAGMLLVLNSKNNPQDVLDTFAANPQMPLQLRHFVGWRLNWDSKADNLISLAAELSLGVDSFLFVDDSPKECAEVAGRLPEVVALPLPEDIGCVPEFLKHVWAFDHPVVTEEDRNRNAYYTQSQEFGREIRSATNLEQFVEGLQLQVVITPLERERLSRVAQLSQRTNQFNFTTIRRTEAEIDALLTAGGYECFTVQVQDRFGSYGLVGVVIFHAAGGALDIDTFLLSCRVLGRGVEHRMLAWLGDEAQRRDLAAVTARLAVTKKNAPARQFLHSIGKDVEIASEGEFRYRFDPQRLRGLQWSASTSVEAPKAEPKAAPPSSRRFVDYAGIANQLTTAARILEAMRHESEAAHAHAGREPMTELETQLAAIWSDLLKHPVVASSDNFFDLGGHSLLAVLLIARVREAFGVELTIDDVYSATLTLGELARKVETYQLSRLNPEEYQALLAEIEGLSDEEVQALLAKEDPGVIQS